MSNAVFIFRPDSIYDDNPEIRYQFPRQYFSRAKKALSDWIVYYESTKVPHSRGYFATAMVKQIIPDPSAPDMFVALIEPGTYLDFASPVGFNLNDSPVEQGLLNAKGKISGRAQAAVRPISASDMNRILALGLDNIDHALPRTEQKHDGIGLEERPSEFVFDAPRVRLSQLTSRAFRDKAFRGAVLRAYDQRCAFTGLRLINGGGRAEVEAAHIKPVQRNGPDILSNGIALSGTAHWMFDRGLLSLDNEFRFLVSHKVNDRDGVTALLNNDGLAKLPERPSERPRLEFLAWHRQEHGFSV